MGNYWSEALDAIMYGHLDTTMLKVLDNTDLKGILDVYWYVYNYTSFKVRTDINASLETLSSQISTYVKQDKIAAFYVMDEPNIHSFSNAEIEAGIAALKKVFPTIPTYLVFAEHCFDPSFKCPTNVPSAQRGIPSNVDWVGFDWYISGNNLWSDLQAQVVDGVQLLSRLCSKSIVLIPDALSLFQSEAVLMEIQNFYFALAYQYPNIIGLDFFLWADNSMGSPPFNGLHTMTELRAVTRAFGREVRKQCGQTPDVIPILEYAIINQDYYYSAWYWQGYPGSGYAPQGVRFGLAPTQLPGSAPFYECVILQQQYANHWLTFSDNCDGIPLKPGTVPTLLGYAFHTQTPDTVAIWRYDQIAVPWPHIYLPSVISLPGFKIETIVGYAYPPSKV
jgi:hypothetical protein